MAKTHTIHARHIICAKLKSEWEQSANANLVPLKGEFCLEINDTELAKQNPDLNEVFKLKVGDGTSKYSELPYLFTTKKEICDLIGGEVVANTDSAIVDTTASADPYLNFVLDGEVKTSHKLKGEDKITISYNDTTHTISVDHDNTTRQDTESSTTVSSGDRVVTGVTSDNQGHITGITTNPLSIDIAEHSESDTDKGVAVQVTTENGSVSGVDVAVTNADLIAGGVIDDGIAVTNPWISKTTDNSTKVVTLAHTDPSTEDSNKSITEVAKDTHILTGISIDAKGHVRTKPDIKELTVEPSGKIGFGTLDASTIQLVHVETDRNDDPQIGNMSFGTAVVTGVTTDVYGHVTCVTTKAIPTDPTDIAEHSETDTDKGITVAVTTEDAQVSGVDVSVNISTLSQELGLSGAMHFIGVSITAITDGGTEDPTIAGYTGTAKTPGNVVLYGGQEFVWTGTAWELLGDEGSYALKTRSISAGDELTGGGTLEADRTINHEEKLGSTKAGSYGPTQETATTLTNGTTFKVPRYTVNKYGHITNTSEIEFTASDHTYTVNEGDLTIQGNGTTAATFNANDANDVNLNIKGSGATTVTASTNEIIISSTDQSVDSAAHHYTPSTDSSSTIDLDASGATAADNIDVVTGITVSRDSKGHVTDVTIDSGKVVSVGNGELSIQANGTEAIDFTANQSSNETLDIKGDGQGTGATGVIEVTTPSSGNISVSHKAVSHTTTQGTVATTGYTEKETDSLVVTGVTTDSYGHITDVKVEPSTNLIAADIKAPVTRTDDSMWNYRETGGDITIGEDTARIPSLKGNTMVWNQVVNKDTFSGSKEEAGVTFTNNGDGSVTVNGTASANTSYYLEQRFNNRLSEGHIYYVKGGSGSIYVRDTYVGQISVSVNTIWKAPTTLYRIDLTLSMYSGGSTNNVTVYPQFIDLTKLFGSDFNIEKALLGLTTEVAWDNLTADQLALAATNFEKLFPNSYYPYCEGRLVNLGGYGVKMNQLVQNGNFADGTNSWRENISSWSVTNNILTITGIYSNQHIYQTISPVYVSNHKYLFYVEAKGSTGGLSSNDSSAKVSFDDASNFKKYQFIETSSFTKLVIFSDIGTVQIKSVMLFDLTLMFGPGSEPSIEEFEAMFPNDYYEYNAGTEMNIFDVAAGENKLGLESVGFNQWDEEWELGTYNTSTGEKQPNNVLIRCKNFIPCTPSTQYYFRRGADRPNGYRWLCYYDADKNFIGSYSNGGVNQIFETLANAYYMTFTVSATSYSNDICINISDPARNGQYEPYKSDTLDLDWIRNEGVENFNIWDEEWEIGDINQNTGELIPGSQDRIRCKNFIPVIGGKTYYCGNTYVVYFVFYDEGYNFISNAQMGYHGNYSAPAPDSAAYVRFYCHPSYNITYKNDICINLSNPALNGEYHPYGTKAKYFPQGLLSAGSVYDEVTETNAIKRVGRQKVTGAINDTITLVGCNTSTASYVCALGNIGTLSSGVLTLTVAVTDAEVYYPLATATEIPLDQPYIMSYIVDDHGTEQQLPVNVSSVINAPFVGTFEYSNNFKSAVLDLLKIKGGRAINIDANYEVSAEIVDDVHNSTDENKLISAAQAWVELQKRNVHADIVSQVQSGVVTITPSTRSGTGAPTNVTPDMLGQQYIDTTTGAKKVYVAGGLTSSDWILVGQQ